MRNGQAECRQELKVRYLRLPRLFNDLVIAKADGSYNKRLSALSGSIYPYGLLPMADRERRDLLEIIEDRHSRMATLVASQLPWNTGMN